MNLFALLVELLLNSFGWRMRLQPAPAQSARFACGEAYDDGGLGRWDREPRYSRADVSWLAGIGWLTGSNRLLDYDFPEGDPRWIRLETSRRGRQSQSG